MAFNETTITDALDAFADNADWFEDDSMAKAKLFATACQKLLLLPKLGVHQDETLSFDPVVIKQQLESVRYWIDTNRWRFDETSEHNVVLLDLSEART